MHSVIEEIRKSIFSSLKNRDQCIRIIASMPIPVCKFGRAHFNKSFKAYADYGHCASKKETYYGFKFHVITTTDGFITDFVLTKANVDDRDALWDLVDKYEFITVIGDKGYISNNLSSDLKQEKGIQLLFMKRDNSRTP